jgi:hypothetical protein
MRAKFASKLALATHCYPVLPIAIFDTMNQKEGLMVSRATVSSETQSAESVDLRPMGFKGRWLL